MWTANWPELFLICRHPFNIYATGTVLNLSVFLVRCPLVRLHAPFKYQTKAYVTRTSYLFHVSDVTCMLCMLLVFLVSHSLVRLLLLFKCLTWVLFVVCSFSYRSVTGIVKYCLSDVTHLPVIQEVLLGTSGYFNNCVSDQVLLWNTFI